MVKYYIYMIELKLKNKENEKHFYVGKSRKLEKRLWDHIAKNNKSFKCIEEDYDVIAVQEVHEIIGLDNKMEKNKVDSITSRIENDFVTRKTKANKTNFFYHGGNIADLNLKKYNDEINKYSLIKVSGCHEIPPNSDKEKIDEILKKLINEIENKKNVLKRLIALIKLRLIKS